MPILKRVPRMSNLQLRLLIFNELFVDKPLVIDYLENDQITIPYLFDYQTKNIS